MKEDGEKKKNPSQFGGIVRGARLTCKKTSLEIFRTVVVVARFDPSLYPQIVMDFFFLFFHPLPFVTFYNISKGEPKIICVSSIHQFRLAHTSIQQFS